MSEIKLKACPFCGSEDVIGYKPHDRTNGEFEVCCLDCDVTMYGKSKKATIRKWNTRKPMERIIERIENARQKYQRLVKEQGEKEDEAINILFRGMMNIVKEEGGIE